MFNLSSTKDSSGNYEPTETHTDHLGHHAQIKILQKGNFAHWFLNREKIHSEVYNEIQNYLNLKENLHTF